MDDLDPRSVPGYYPPRYKGLLGMFRRFGDALESLDRNMQRWRVDRRIARDLRERQRSQKQQPSKDQQR